VKGKDTAREEGLLIRMPKSYSFGINIGKQIVEIYVHLGGGDIRTQVKEPRGGGKKTPVRERLRGVCKEEDLSKHRDRKK